jgi:formate-dependent nitrite reductase membrane component NrfD
MATALACIPRQPGACRRDTPRDSLLNLERTDRWAMLLELVLLVAFVISLGSLASVFLASPYGLLLLLGTLVAGVLLPLLLHWRPRSLGSNATLVAAVLALIGGFVLRYAIVMAGQYVSVAGL